MDCVGCDKCKLWGKLQVSYFTKVLKENIITGKLVLFGSIWDICSVLMIRFLNRWQAWAPPLKSSSLVTLTKTEGQNWAAVQARACQGTNLTWPSLEMKLWLFSMPLARSLPALFSLRSFERCYGKDDCVIVLQEFAIFLGLLQGWPAPLSVIHSVNWYTK